MRCEICGEHHERRKRMCDACKASYARYAFNDSSVMAALVWAARRARRYEQKRQRAIRIKAEWKAYRMAYHACGVSGEDMAKHLSIGRARRS